MTRMDELERMDTAFSPAFPEMYHLGAYGMQVREARTLAGWSVKCLSSTWQAFPREGVSMVG